MNNNNNDISIDVDAELDIHISDESDDEYDSNDKRKAYRNKRRMDGHTNGNQNANVKNSTKLKSDSQSQLNSTISVPALPTRPPPPVNPNYIDPSQSTTNITSITTKPARPIMTVPLSNRPQVPPLPSPMPMPMPMPPPPISVSTTPVPRGRNIQNINNNNNNTDNVEPSTSFIHTYDKTKQPVKSALKRNVKFFDETDDHPFADIIKNDNSNKNNNNNNNNINNINRMNGNKGNDNKGGGQTPNLHNDTNTISQIIELHKNIQQQQTAALNLQGGVEPLSPTPTPNSAPPTQSRSQSQDGGQEEKQAQSPGVLNSTSTTTSTNANMSGIYDRKHMDDISFRDAHVFEKVTKAVQKSRNPKKAKEYIIYGFTSVFIGFLLSIWAFVATNDQIVYIPCDFIMFGMIVYIYSYTWKMRKILKNVYGPTILTDESVKVFREYSTQFGKLRINISNLRTMHLATFFIIFMNININLKNPQYNPTGYFDTFKYLSDTGKSIFILLIFNMFVGFGALTLAEKEAEKLCDWYKYKMIVTEEHLRERIMSNNNLHK